MKKWSILLLLVLSFVLTACGANKSTDLDASKSNASSDESVQQQKPSKDTTTEPTTTYFESDEVVNKFFADYNAFAEITIPASEIEKGNIRTKALVYMDDLSLEVINAEVFLSISMSTSVDNENGKLYSVFRDTLKTVQKGLAEEDIQSVWNAVHETGYVTEGYNLNGISITYIPSMELSWGTSDLRVDLNIPLN